MKVAKSGWLSPGQAFDRIVALRADTEDRAAAAAERVRAELPEREATIRGRVPEIQRGLLEVLLAAAAQPQPEIEIEPAPDPVVEPEPVPSPKPKRRKR